jgi:hypothetical protein
MEHFYRVYARARGRIRHGYFGACVIYMAQLLTAQLYSLIIADRLLLHLLILYGTRVGAGAYN